MTIFSIDTSLRVLYIYIPRCSMYASKKRRRLSWFSKTRRGLENRKPANVNPLASDTRFAQFFGDGATVSQTSQPKHTLLLVLILYHHPLSNLSPPPPLDTFFESTKGEREEELKVDSHIVDSGNFE